MRLFCPNCSARLNIPESLYGKKGKCSKCSTIIDIPTCPPEEPTELLSLDTEQLLPNKSRELNEIDNINASDTKKAELLFQRAKENIKRKFYDRAIEDLLAAVTYDRQATYYYNLGIAFTGKGELKLSVDAFSMAVKLDPSYHEAYCYRAIAYSAMGCYELSKDDFEHCINLNPVRRGTYESMMEELLYKKYYKGKTPDKHFFCPNCKAKMPAYGGMGCLENIVAVVLCFIGIVPAIIWLQIFYKPYKCVKCGLPLSAGGTIGWIQDIFT